MADFPDVADVVVPFEVVGEINTQKFDAGLVNNIGQSGTIVGFGTANTHFLSLVFVQGKFN